MKSFKTYGTYGLLLMLLLIGSCTSEECAGVICYNDGICVDGECECDLGYEEDCTVESREKFLGVYQATTAINGSALQGILTITEYPGNVLRMYVDSRFYIELVDNRTVTVPSQEISINGVPRLISGNGTYFDNVINLNLRYDFPNGQSNAFTIRGVK